MDHNTNLEYLYSISSDELHRQHRPAQITQYVPANSDEEMRNLGGSSLFAARLLKARFSSSSLFPLPVWLHCDLYTAHTPACLLCGYTPSDSPHRLTARCDDRLCLLVADYMAESSLFNILIAAMFARKRKYERTFILSIRRSRVLTKSELWAVSSSHSTCTFTARRALFYSKSIKPTARTLKSERESQMHSAKAVSRESIL